MRYNKPLRYSGEDPDVIHRLAAWDEALFQEIQKGQPSNRLWSLKLQAEEILYQNPVYLRSLKPSEPTA